MVQRLIPATLVLCGLAACGKPSQNTAPESEPLEATGTEDTLFTGALPDATDADGDEVTYVLAAPASRGTVEVQKNGSFTYMPNQDFYGYDTFAFGVSDGRGGTNSYPARILVNEVNDAPRVGNQGLVIPWGGYFVTAFESGQGANGVVLDAEDRILVAGTIYSGASQDFALARFSANGIADATFGATAVPAAPIPGVVITDFTAGQDAGSGLAIYPGNRIVVAGTRTGGGSTLALARYLESGALDPAFGGGSGKVTTDIGTGTAGGNAVATLGDRIFVAGRSSNGADTDFLLAAYRANGTLDTSGFGDVIGVGVRRGYVTSHFASGNDAAFSLVAADSGILLAGSALNAGGNSDFALARYTTLGAPDAAFGGGDGLATSTPCTGLAPASEDVLRGVAVTAGGSILAAGYAVEGGLSSAVLAGFNSDGSRNTGFGGPFANCLGVAFPAFGQGVAGTQHRATSLVVDSFATTVGRIAVAGYREEGGNRNFALARFTDTGQVDNDFGTAGVASLDLGSATDEARSILQDAQGRFLLAGSSGGQFALARFDNTGGLDPLFATNVGSASGKGVRFVLGDGYFVDPESSPLTYTATLANGAPLPPELTFLPAGVLIGRVPASKPDILITATDPSGESVSATFSFY